MQTIHKLCRYKDITDLVYLQLHRLLVKDLIKELNDLAQVGYVLNWCRYPLFSDDYGWDMPCFNYRVEFNCVDLIYHISHKDHKLQKTGFHLPQSICNDKKTIL